MLWHSAAHVPALSNGASLNIALFGVGGAGGASTRPQSLALLCHAPPPPPSLPLPPSFHVPFPLGAVRCPPERATRVRATECVCPPLLFSARVAAYLTAASRAFSKLAGKSEGDLCTQEYCSEWEK